MKTLLILAAAATFAACHNRSDDEMGAAPDRGDHATVQPGYDTTMAQPTPSPSTSGYDTIAAPVQTPEPAAPEPAAPEPAASPSTGGYDSTGMGTDSTMSPSAGNPMPADTAGTPQ